MLNCTFKSFHSGRRRSGAIAAFLAAGLVLSQASIPTTYPTGSGVNIGYSNGHVVYGYNSVGDSIPDYSSAGYGGGGVTIPTPAVTDTMSPSGGDDTSALQNMINTISARPVGANGFRGVLKLNAGVFHYTTPLTITASGIVIRGAGSGTSGTILRSTTGTGPVFNVDNGSSRTSGTSTSITTSYVPVGATYFAVSSTSGFSVGDTVQITRTPTTAWISQLPESVTTRSYTVKWDRIITEIDGNRVRLDAPINQALDIGAGWCSGTLTKYTWSSRLSNVGIEDIRGDAPGQSVDSLGNTGGSFLTFAHCINCWARRCYNDKMRGHTAEFNSGSKWCTCEDINSFHNGTSASHSGSSIQIFTGDSSDAILYHHITASNGGFEFSASSHNGGPFVYTECTVPDSFAASGPHQESNVGMLWDRCDMPGQGISVQYQSHGWGGFDCLAYNNAGSLNFERPNLVHQWIIGGTGSWNHAKNGNDPEVISFGSMISPTSLYRAQLIDRVGATQANAVLGSTTIGDTDTGNGGGNPPDFSISATPSSRTVTAGNSTSYTATISAINGFNNSVSFSVTGLPAGASGTFNPTSVPGSGSSTLSVTTSTSTPAGTYPLTITGTDGTVGPHSTTVTLVVNAPPPDFTISATPSSQTVTAGSGTSYTVNVGAINGFNGSVSFSVSGLPSGAGGSFNPASVTGSGSSTLSVTTSTSTPAGTYPLTITGTDGTVGPHSTTVTLVVNGTGGNCLTATSDGVFNNTAMASQTGNFTVTFDATPTVSPFNANVGLSQGPATAYTSIACSIRFNQSGDIDARNGGVFAAASTIPFSANLTYHFRIVVNVPAHTYSIFVTPPGGSELTVGSNFAFRTEQNTVTSLDNWVANVNTSNPGSLTVCNFSAAGGFTNTYEAENLAIASTSGKSFTTNSETGASGGKYVQYLSTATGDFATFTLPNVPAGTYSVTFGYKQNSNRGIVQASVGPAGGTLTNLGSPLDQFGSSAFLSVNLGTWTVSTTGNQSFKVLVTGKNASATGFNFTVDYIKLTSQ